MSTSKSKHLAPNTQLLELNNTTIHSHNKTQQHVKKETSQPNTRKRETITNPHPNCIIKQNPYSQTASTQTKTAKIFSNRKAYTNQ